jgi:hypothetical protein
VISSDGGTFPGNQKLGSDFKPVGPFPHDPGYTLETSDGRPIKIKTGGVTYFPFDRDVEITIKTPITITREIGIYGGRSVIVKGDGSGDIFKKLDPNMPSRCDLSTDDCKKQLSTYRPSVATVLRLDSQRRSVVIENLKIHVSGDFTDAIAFRQNPNTFKTPEEFANFEGIDVFVRNFSAYDIGGAVPGLHGDIVQLQNGVYRNMFFENIDGTTGYQGFFLPNRPFVQGGNPYLCANVPEGKRCFSPMIVKGKAYFRNIVLRSLENPELCPNCPIPYRGLYTVDNNVNKLIDLGENYDKVKASLLSSGWKAKPVLSNTKPFIRAPEVSCQPDNSGCVAYFSRDSNTISLEVTKIGNGDKDSLKIVLARETYTAPSYATVLQNVTFFTDPRPNPRNKLPLYVLPAPSYSTLEGTIDMTKQTNGAIMGQLNIISTNYDQAKASLLRSDWKPNPPRGSIRPFKAAPEVSCETIKKTCEASFKRGSSVITFKIKDFSAEKNTPPLLTIIGANY